MAHFSLVSHWRIDAPIERVWDVLIAVDEWPRWWRYLKAVVALEEGDAEGVGSLRRYTWTSRLPYRLIFEMRTTVVRRLTLIEGVAVGDVRGTGRWQLRAFEKSCCVRYDWTVATGKPWMTLAGPLMAPLYAWNHNQVMQAGGRGLARHLGVALLAPAECSTDPIEHAPLS